MANIIDYDFTVSFCSEANGSILTWTLGNQFVNTAKWDFGTHEIASQ